MLPTQNFELLVINALPIFLRTSVTLSSLKIGLKVPKASELINFFKGGVGVGGNGEIKF